MHAEWDFHSVRTLLCSYCTQIMKFICCSYNKNENPPFNIYVMPDTALHINKRPLFIPDYANPCVMHLHRAVRICRLGKSISERFASRYYDSITLCARMEAPGIPPSIGRTFDECVSVGEWIALDSAGNAQNQETADNSEQISIDHAFSSLAAQAIAEVSKYYTLRQGDVILLDENLPAEEIHINQHIEENFCGKLVLQFNIK